MSCASPAPAASDRETIAAFDFDGTLTRTDTLVRFLLAAVGTRRFVRRAAPLLPAAVGWAAKQIPDEEMVPDLLRRVLPGIPADEAEGRAAEFAQAYLPTVLRRAAVDRLGWHLGQGHTCIVITASPERYVGPWAAGAGFQAVLGTRLATDAAGRLTGLLDGPRCAGEEKVRRLRRHLTSDLSEYVLHAYGDSRSDAPLLDVADFAYYRRFGDPHQPSKGAEL